MNRNRFSVISTEVELFNVTLLRYNTRFPVNPKKKLFLV